MTKIYFRKAMADPPAVDPGNQVLQGRRVSKTIQLSLFTTNKNAVWAANNQLQKESYPFKTISLPVNRNMFRLQVGDPFLLSYSKYSIVNKIFRVLTIREGNIESEQIEIQAAEDPFAITNAVDSENYINPGDNSIQRPDYTVYPFDDAVVLEAPYILTPDGIGIIPLAAKNDDNILGFNTYVSVDGGTSYSFVGKIPNTRPYGVLASAYSADTLSIDNEDSIVVDFESGQDSIDSITFTDCLSGKNMAFVGNEIITFSTITPITTTQYELTGIIRGRFGSQKEDHLAGSDFYFLGNEISFLTFQEALPGVTRQIKLVPYNIKLSGSVADATAIDLSLSGKSRTPYIPTNFVANGASFASRYDTDIVLAWSGRKRGTGAGIGVPGIVLSSSAHEGLFDVEVYVNLILVRTISDVDALTYTYTEAMNLSDNVSLATEVVFKLTNHITENGYKYESDQVEVTCLKN